MMSERGLYRRHAESCKQGKKHGRLFSKCPCPIWFDERRDGHRVHHSMGTTDWAAAIAAVQGNPMVRTPGHKEFRYIIGNDGLTPHSVETAPARVSLAEVIEKFESWHRGQGLEASSLAASENTLKQFRTYCPVGIFADQIGAETFDGYRLARLRTISTNTLSKELHHLRTLWKWGEDRDLLKKLPTATFKPPAEKKGERVSKAGFEPGEVTAILRAIPTLKNQRERLRAKALILTALHSGMAIVDIAQLKRSEIDSTGRLVKQRQKTEGPLDILLDTVVLEALAALPRESETYYFWSGEGSVAGATDNLRNLLKKVYQSAGVGWDRQPAHKLRHTTAAVLRQAGVSIQDQASHLGNEPGTLEKYYSGQIQADRDRRDAVTAKLKFGEPAGV